MKFENIHLGKEVDIEPSTSINNLIIGDRVRIGKRCSIYGGPDNLLEIGSESYVGMCSLLNGRAAKLYIGPNVSISQYVNIMVDSGPNASPAMMRIFPIVKGPVTIHNDCWIGACAIIMPNVTLGEFCVVASNSFVNSSFPGFLYNRGTPAKLIRSFTEEEKGKMLANFSNVQSEEGHYETNYLDLPFEDKLRNYRKKNIFEKLNSYQHKSILEIGCGPDPLFNTMDDFDKMVVVEPSRIFFDMVQSLVQGHSNISIINDSIENVADSLKTESFDFIVIGGFLHEVDNPDEVLNAVSKVCSGKTIVYSFVPNAKSFHRILALKMGIIKTVYEKSEYDALFERRSVYNVNTFCELFTKNNFHVLDSGSYFIKPFTHAQMGELLGKQIIDEVSLDGLEKMIEYLPDMGTEIWNICQVKK